MLEKPDLPDDSIVACLAEAYALDASDIAFLPLGADANTAVYRASTVDDTPYFVKLRRGAFDVTSVTLPRQLHDLGILQIIPPLPSKAGRLWAPLSDFTVILYPFVEGHNGYERRLSDQQWIDFGSAMRRIHTAVLPPAMRIGIQREVYSSQWRGMVKRFLRQIESESFAEPVAARLAAFLKTRRDQIIDLIARTEQLAQGLKDRPAQDSLCHSDIHAGNILIAADNALYIVDWDAPILAPRERDLMFIGGGLMGRGRTAQEEERLFYRGYGQVEIDAMALAYYRYERIIQDIAAYCEELLLTMKGGADREQSLEYLMASFRPGGVLAIAYQSDSTLHRG